MLLFPWVQVKFLEISTPDLVMIEQKANLVPVILSVLR